jgi:lipopolysaccharide export system protein LptA
VLYRLQNNWQKTPNLLNFSLKLTRKPVASLQVFFGLYFAFFRPHFGYNQFMTKIYYRLLSSLVVASLGFFAQSASAEKADRDKPINAQADSLKYDDLKQTSVFTGNVIITKGTIIMRGARIDVRQDPEGYQYAVVSAEPGKLAYFKQKRENGQDEWIEGEAVSVEYDGKADKVKLIKNAVLKRLRGVVLNDDISGNLITYDNTTDVYNVEGGAAKNADGSGGGRVRAILSPKSANNTTAPTPASGMPGGITTQLRSTPAISSEKK